MARPVLLVIISVTCLQFGTALATTVFAEAGPMGSVWIRSLVGGVLLAAYIRPKFRSFTRFQMRAILPFALALVALNVFFYLALDRAPLGVVSAIEMLGPLAVAAAGRRAGLDLVWVAFAAVGVMMLTLSRGVSGNIETLGIVFALVAATAWGLYIVLGKRVSQRVDGLGGLAIALLISAAIQTPLGLTFGEPGLWSLEVLAILAIAGILSTLVPFALEMTALKTLSMGTFGLLLAFEPVAAALAGRIVRDQRLSAIQIAGIALIILASVGVLLPKRWLRRIAPYDRGVTADPKLDALGQVPLFEGLNAKELGALGELVEERSAGAGDVLVEQDTEGDEFFVVLEGSVDIQRDGHQVAQLGPGDFLGEIALVFGGQRVASAVVREPARLFVLSRDAFRTMTERHPRIEGKILETVTTRLRYR